MSKNESNSQNSNEPEQNSTPPEPNSKLEQLKAFLKEDGVDLDKLVICMLGGAECVIGETGDPGANRGRYDADTPGYAGHAFVIKNPKRVMRRQEQRGDVASIIFYLADFDLIGGGVMEVCPVAASKVVWLSEQSQYDYAGLYVIYLKQKEEERLARSGLVKPATPTSSFFHLICDVQI
jgi:hypothetical protein